MDLELKGNVAIVTGASRGIGRAIAQTLAAEGVRLVLAARSRDLLEQLAGSLKVECLIQPIDLRDPATPGDVVDAAVKKFGRLDLLVNNAGATQRGDFLKLTDEQWADGYALKFFGAMRCCRSAWPHLVASKGSIVNIVGIGGRTGTSEFTIGGSVNAAVLNLTKCLADRGVSDGVRVNAINPGSIATERLTTRVNMLAAERGIEPNRAAAEMAAAMKIGRFGESAEIASVVAFLASKQAAYLNGAVIDVDGGATRTL